MDPVRGSPGHRGDRAGLLLRPEPPGDPAAGLPRADGTRVRAGHGYGLPRAGRASGHAGHHEEHETAPDARHSALLQRQRGDREGVSETGILYFLCRPGDLQKGAETAGSGSDRAGGPAADRDGQPLSRAGAGARAAE